MFSQNKETKMKKKEPSSYLQFSSRVGLMCMCGEFIPWLSFPWNPPACAPQKPTSLSSPLCPDFSPVACSFYPNTIFLLPLYFIVIYLMCALYHYILSSVSEEMRIIWCICSTGENTQLSQFLWLQFQVSKQQACAFTLCQYTLVLGNQPRCWLLSFALHIKCEEGNNT